MSDTKPTLYLLDATGAGGALEAHTELYFCSPACRDIFASTTGEPNAPGQGSEWLEDHVCEQCGNPLEVKPREG